MPAAPLPFSRKLVYAAIVAGAATALLLGTLELALRLVGYGYSPHFARRATFADGNPGWRENRWTTAPYFTSALVRRPQPFRLPLTKPPHTYRIFVLGSSAAMGDPEPSFSLARVLEKLLGTAYPDIRFEVVNAGITAINSHLVRGIAADCAQLQPDLFIVYEGNNEVIGPFGPSGVFTPFLRSETAVRFAVWIKGTRTGQAISALARRLAGQSAAPADWGGMQMFLQQAIAVDDPRLAAVAAHFEANLRSISASAHAAGARTLLCTVLTNQRDFAPFLSRHRSDLTTADLARWETEFHAAEAAQRAGDLAGAERAYRAARLIDDRYAELEFRLGRLRLQQGDDGSARTLLRRARDLDCLRFRTDSTLNDTIRRLGQAGLPDCEVVDLATDLAARCAHELTGDEMLYEHVHLTLPGTYAAARELFERIGPDLVRRGLVARPATAAIDYEQTKRRLGYTMHEQAMIALELIQRFRKPPFSGQSDDNYRLHAWERRAKQAGELLARPDALPALRVLYEQAIAASPNDWILARNAGAMFVARKAPAEALPLLQRAAAWIDDDIDTLVPLGWAERELGQAAESDAVFARARALEPNYPGLPKSP